MRSFFYLVLLGIVLVTIALVVRSGIAARKDPGTPINSAMRHALEKSHAAEAGEVDPVEEKFGPLQKTSSGLRYRVLAPGAGDTPKPGAEVTVHFEGKVLGGKEFDSSYQRQKPMTFHIGEGLAIKGWEEALLSMKKGEKRLLIVPHWLAYGEKAEGPIPAHATLIYELELLDFR